MRTFYFVGGMSESFDVYLFALLNSNARIPLPFSPNLEVSLLHDMFSIIFDFDFAAERCSCILVCVLNPRRVYIHAWLKHLSLATCIAIVPFGTKEIFIIIWIDHALIGVQLIWYHDGFHWWSVSASDAFRRPSITIDCRPINGAHGCYCPEPIFYAQCSPAVVPDPYRY